MERSNSTSSNAGFWATIDLLIGKDWKDTARDLSDEPERENQINNALALKYNKNIPRDSLTGEELSWSSRRQVAHKNNSQGPDCITDKKFMSQLQEHIKQVQDLAMQQRIAAREKDEMNRLKKLILSGKSPLKDCPPELQGHPVFTFWNLVNTEMDKIAKAKFESFSKKQKRSREKLFKYDQPDSAEAENQSVASCSDDQSRDLDEGKLETDAEASSSSSDEHQFTPREFTAVKYEDESVKELRELTTVEELYQMADQIIGIPNVSDTFR